MKLKVTDGSEPRLEVPAEGLADLGLAPEDRVQVTGVRGTVVLTGHEQPFLAGDLRAFSMADVLTTLQTGRHGGTLHLAVPEGRKTLRFVGGEVAFAASTLDADRLGEALWRAGLIARDDIETCGQEVGGRRRLGDVLVARGLLTSAQLYQGLVYQVRDIVLSLFHAAEGRFVFVEHPVEGDRVRLEESARDLILAGIRQQEEVGRWRRIVPEGTVLEPGPPSAERSPSPAEEEMLALADGTATAEELIASSALGLHQGLRTLAGLVSEGLLLARRPEGGAGVPASSEDRSAQAGEVAPPSPDELAELEALTPVEASPEPAEGSPSAQPFLAYARAIARVHQVLARARKEPEALNDYLDRAPAVWRPLFDGVRLDAEGQLDLDRLVENAQRLHGDQYRGRTLEALDALQTYALFQARNVLPADLAAKVQRLVMLIQLGKA